MRFTEHEMVFFNSITKVIKWEYWQCACTIENMWHRLEEKNGSFGYVGVQECTHPS